MKSVLIISTADNVETALEALEVGRVLDLAGRTSVVVRDPIAAGHKVALTPIAAGANVVKRKGP